MRKLSQMIGRLELKGLNPKFIAKMLLSLLVMYIAFHLFTARYFIGEDPQKERCLPNHKFYLVDKKDKVLEKGKVYAFHAKGLDPIYKDGTKMVKILVAMPGDTVEVDSEGRVLVNDEEVAFGLSQAYAINKEPADFTGKGLLGDGKYWFLGTTTSSFDSRYWGSVDEDQIIGRTYGIY